MTAESSAGGALRRDAAAWGAVAVGVAVLCAVFGHEILAAISVWNSSTAYGHCWLVLPIVAWLLWERRGVLADRPARPAPWAALLAVPLALAWVAADLLDITEGRQLAAVGFVLLLLLAALGWRLWWALSAGFLYLLFLVPFGAFVTGALQHFTAGFIVAGLRALDIPYEADNFQIAIPEGVFYVAEACAGLRFLIASIAFGVLYAVTMFRSPVRRAVFIAVSCVVPVVANGIRGLGIVLLGHALGSAEAGAADHIIYGWVFFSAVIVLLAVAGLPFREAPAPSRPPTSVALPRTGQALPALACLPVLLLAVAGPVLTGPIFNGPVVNGPVLATAAPATRIVRAAGTPPGCASDAVNGSSRVAVATFRCGEQTVRVTRTTFGRRAGPTRILAAARQPAAFGPEADVSSEVWWTTAPPYAPWVLARAEHTGRLAAYAVRVDGVQGTGSLRDRLRMVVDMVGQGGTDAPLAEAVTVEPGGAQAETLLKTILTQLSQDSPLSGAASP